MAQWIEYLLCQYEDLQKGAEVTTYNPSAPTVRWKETRESSEAYEAVKFRIYSNRLQGSASHKMEGKDQHQTLSLVYPQHTLLNKNNFTSRIYCAQTGFSKQVSILNKEKKAGLYSVTAVHSS